MSDVPIYTKAEMDAQLDRISALTAELETVKGERAFWENRENEALKRALAVEAKLAGGEAVDVRHFNILAEAMAEVKATSDGLSDQSIAEIVAGCIEEINALTHPAPTHNDGSGEAVAWRYRSPWIVPKQGMASRTTGFGPWRYTEDAATANGRTLAGDEVQPLFTRSAHTGGEVTEVTEAMVDAFKRNYRMHLGDGETPIDFKAEERKAVRMALEAALRGDAS